MLTRRVLSIALAALVVAGGVAAASPVAASSLASWSLVAPTTAAPPVADSSDLPAYLGVTPDDPETAGLPAEGLDPQSSYTAMVVGWVSGDDFVDVYLYSAPVVVGTFPVVAGVIEIPLSSALLSSVSAGPHTLVLVGTASGNPRGVALSVLNSLSATGSEPSLSLIGISGALLVAGAAVLLWRRRTAASI